MTVVELPIGDGGDWSWFEALIRNKLNDEGALEPHAIEAVIVRMRTTYDQFGSKDFINVTIDAQHAEAVKAAVEPVIETFQRQLTGVMMTCFLLEIDLAVAQQALPS